MAALRVVLLLVVCALGASAQHPAEFAAGRALEHPGYLTAARAVDLGYERFVNELIELTEIPAPPFKEDARAEAFMRLCRASGLTSVERDDEGNVLALRRGRQRPAARGGRAPRHGVPRGYRRDGPPQRHAPVGARDRRQRPGRRRPARARARHERGAIQTSSDILFVGNVGEEGNGALRGVRHLFTSGRYKDRIRAFISIDGMGSGDYITTGGVGSRRYRVTFNGPGGHSYGAFGLVNPATAMAGAMQHLAALKVPASPKTTFNVGMIGGGTSVNTIPSSVWMDVDLRSESPAELAKLDAGFKDAVTRAVADENRSRSTADGASAPTSHCSVNDRPARRRRTTALVVAATAAMRATGLQPAYGWSSTDANLPMSLGIPAITIDTGIQGDRAHAPDEWIDVDRRRVVSGLQRVC